MAVKRDIRKELKERSAKDFFKVFKKIMNFISRVDRKRFFSIIFLRLILAIEPIITLYLFQELINSAINKKFSITLLAFLGIMRLVAEIVGYISKAIEVEYEYNLMLEVDKKVQEKVLELDIRDLENKETHNNLQRATNTSNLFRYYLSRILDVIFKAFQVIIYSLILFKYNAIITLLILILPMYLILKKLQIAKENFIKRWEEADSWRYQRYYSNVMTTDNFFLETKSLAVDHIYFEKYKEAAKKLKKMNVSIYHNMMKADKKISILNAITGTAFFGYLIYNLSKGKIQVGNFNTYRSAFSNTSMNIDWMLGHFVDFEVDSIEINEFFKFLEIESVIVDGEKGLKKINKIEFQNISFKYNDESEYVLKNINITFNKNENIALIGPNGSGKTTTMKLLLRIYEPSEGKILINGIDLKEYKIESIRNKISILLQDFNLFQESVEENITLGLKKEVDLKKHIVYNDLRERIEELPEKLKTVLGSWFGEGINFSKGQIQKLALSRVFFRDSEFVLLDEPNSALDPRSEKEMFTYIKNNQKTSIVTLHVFTNIEMLDRIIMFEKGEVVADGKHDDLYKNNQIYKEYYDLQEKPLEE